VRRGLPSRAATLTVPRRAGSAYRSTDRRELSPAEQFAPPALGDVLDFMRLLWRVDHALQLASKRMERVLGVTGPQRLVLRILGKQTGGKHPGLPAGRLARWLHLHPSTLTGILQRLDRKGLIVRRPDPGDARRVLLGLTRKGRSLDVGTEGTIESVIEAVLRRSSRPTIGRMREFLVRLGEGLDERYATIARNGRERIDR
jgi:DNA-binding MarR family transcriptional regulator